MATSTIPAADLEESFRHAQARVKDELTSRPSDDELLQIYALFKQATVGPNTTPQPGFLSFKAKAKWAAWAALGNLSAYDAKVAYIKQSWVLYGKYS